MSYACDPQDSNQLSKTCFRKPCQPVVVLYILPIIDDDGIVFYYDQTRYFLEAFMSKLYESRGDWGAWLHVRLVHQSESIRVRRAVRGDAFKCYENRDDYMVTEIPQNILKDLIYRSFANFRRFFASRVPDMASSCDAFAYDAMYKDLNAYKRVQDDVKALQLTLQPFSIHYSARLTHDALYGPHFQEGPNSAYRQLLGQCNRDDMFVDSALIFTNGEYTNDEWVDSLTTTSFKARIHAWTELLKCVISDAPNDAPNKLAPMSPNDSCFDYENGYSHYTQLTDHNLRNTCPMIPNRDRPFETAQLIRTLAHDFVKSVDMVTSLGWNK